jgi:hypothetical protein
VTTELLVGLIAVSAVFAGPIVVAGHNGAPMFILAHQFCGVSSGNNRPDTYPAEFAQASCVQSVKHLVCKYHPTMERRLGCSWRHIGLREASALPQHTVPHPRERISGPASQNESKASRCFEPAADVCERLPKRRMRGRPIIRHPSHRVLDFCRKFTAERFATYH